MKKIFAKYNRKGGHWKLKRTSHLSFDESYWSGNGILLMVEFQRLGTTWANVIPLGVWHCHSPIMGVTLLCLEQTGNMADWMGKETKHWKQVQSWTTRLAWFWIFRYSHVNFHGPRTVQNSASHILSKWWHHHSPWLVGCHSHTLPLQ